MCARSGVGTNERKRREEPGLVPTGGLRWAEHPAGPAAGKGGFIRKIPLTKTAWCV